MNRKSGMYKNTLEFTLSQWKNDKWEQCDT